MVQPSNTAFGLPGAPIYSYPTDLLTSLYPYAALGPTLASDEKRAGIAAAGTRAAASIGAKGGVQQQQIATQGSLQQTLAQIAANHQAGLMDTSQWLAQMQGSGQLRDTIAAMQWRAGQAPQPGAMSAWSGPVPQLQNAFAPPSDYIPQALAMAPGQNGSSSGSSRRTYRAAQGMPQGGNYSIIVGDGAGIQPGISEVLNIGPDGKPQNVSPIVGTAATGYPPTDPSGLTMGQGVVPPMPSYEGDVVVDYYNPGLTPPNYGSASEPGGGSPRNMSTGGFQRGADRFGFGAPRPGSEYADRLAGGQTGTAAPRNGSASGFGSGVSGVPSGFVPTPGSPIPNGAHNAFNYGNGQATGPNSNQGTGPSSGGASIPPAPAFNAPISNPINNLPFVQALRPGGMAPPQFQQYGSQPAFAELGINAVNSPFQAASQFAQMTPYDQEQALQLYESMGIPRMVALAEMANATPGFRMNPLEAFSYA